ncbi:MAG: phosphatidate cytidylyltransferase [candidate division Zixibacteria bacterium]|nr:phosphatidate cytidylyltransferase [candidate division Zixibacteria bacterium]
MISKNLAQRLTVAAIAIPAILFMIFKGGDLFLYFVLLLSIIGIYEYLRALKISFVSPFFILPFCGAIGAVFLSMRGYSEYSYYCLLGVFLLVGILLATGKEPIKDLFFKNIYILWGTFYIGLLFPFVYLIRGDAIYMQNASGGWWVFYMMSSLWVCDSCAMFFGSQFGKHQLAPTVSPNKTIEGFIGGFFGAAIIAAIFKIFWLPEVAWYHFGILVILIGAFGQLGDLVESLWKRAIGIKDSSAIIPGHGGVLDRFDSLLFASPVVYLYLKYIIHANWL